MRVKSTWRYLKMFLGATDVAVERRMAGSTVVSNPEGVSCRLRGSSGNGGGGGTAGNSTLLGGKRSGNGGGGKSSGSSAAGGNSTGGPGSDTGSKGSLQAQVAGPLRPTKPCCFCWCCCCSCSCLAVKNLEENGPTKNSNNSDSLICDGEAPPTIDEIRHWGNSFDKLMKSSGGRKVFRDFLRCEYSEENILFWLACEELKRETNPEIIEEKARKIYEDFISILSPKEVSLDSRVREIVNRNMVEPTPHTFDEAQLQIYTLMHRDSYPRFVNSSLFKNLAQLSSCREGEGGNSNGGSHAGSSTIAVQPAKQSGDNAAG